MQGRFNIAVIGVGATGMVIAAALLKQDPGVICVDSDPALRKAIQKDWIGEFRRLFFLP